VHVTGTFAERSNMSEGPVELVELEEKKKEAHATLENSFQMLQICRDPSVDWSEKKKTVDSVIERRAKAGADLDKLQKQGKELQSEILAKQQELLKVGREAMELAVSRGEIDEIMEYTRKTIANQNAAMQQVHFGGGM